MSSPLSLIPSLPADYDDPVSSAQRSSQLIRIGVVGAGDRVRRIYLPVFNSLNLDAQVVGFTCRQRDKGENFSRKFGWKYFDSISELVEHAKPQLLVIIVSDSSNELVVRQALDFKIPLLSETPISWSLKAGQLIYETAKKQGTPIGIAEQFPFLPAEQLKRKIIELGVLGKVTSAVNEFASYDYHGLAQLRAYIGELPDPLSGSAMQHEFGTTGIVEDQLPPNPDLGWPETWLLGTIEYNNGAMLVHQYSAGYAALPTRPEGRLIVHGTCGNLVDDSLTVVNRITGSIHTSVIRREYTGTKNSPVLARLVIDTPEIGEVAWLNPYTEGQLNEEQIAVACHVDAMVRVVKHGGWPLYSAPQAIKDIELSRALSYSAQLSGSPVRLPLKTRLVKLRLATSPNFLTRKMKEIVRKLPIWTPKP